MDYKGIKIYDKVIIVEKPSSGQGYVVDVGNKKMLDTAMSWAKGYVWNESLREKYWKARDEKGETEEVEAIWEKYQDSKKEIPGIAHEYDNGKFEITLTESADGSSQGGKLSFWNCTIKAPDGKSFLIGINSELLLHLMMKNTLVNGTCQSKGWLGRVKGNQVGFFTENMEEFDQAKEDEKSRKATKTNKYKVGDIIETLTTKELYIGEVYVYADSFEYYTNERTGWWGSSHTPHHFIKIFKKPKKYHGFVNLKYEDSLFHDINLKASKAAKVVTGSNVKLAEKYRDHIQKFKDEWKKLRMKPAELRWKGPQPFYGFIGNIVMRLDNSFTPESIKADMEEINAALIKSGQPRDNIENDIRFENEENKNFDHVDLYWAFSCFRNYKTYYKGEDE